jgi:hypothetical protein
MASHLDEITHSSRISVTVSMIILKIEDKVGTLFKKIGVKVINQKITNVCAEVSFV